MVNFKIPIREDTSSEKPLDSLKKAIGLVPNLYTTFGYSETAFGNYLHNLTKVNVDFPLAQKLELETV